MNLHPSIRLLRAALAVVLLASASTVHAGSAPTITSFSPTSGPVGTTVVINGTNFVPPLSITFGGNVQAGGSFSSTQITVTVPSGAETGPIKVTAAGGSASTATNFVVGSAPNPGTLGFGTSSYSVDEDSGSITVHVLRTGGSAGAASVTCGTSSGTAKSGTDYTGKSQTLSWTDGDTSQKAFTVSIEDLDITDGSTRQFSLKLSSASGATLGSPATATVTVTEDDSVNGEVAFSAASYSVDEDAGSVTVHVVRSVSSVGAISVKCGTSSGTAKSGTDYTGRSQTLSWADGDTSQKAFTVAITDRGNTSGGSLQFDLLLSSPTGGGTVNSPATATVTIAENDSANGKLAFGASSYSVNEDAGSITVHVLRSGGSAGAISVKCGTSSGTAKSGTDYTGKSQTLSWADGDTSQKAFTVSITDRGDSGGGGLQFDLLLSSPAGGANLTSPATATVTIN